MRVSLRRCPHRSSRVPSAEFLHDRVIRTVSCSIFQITTTKTPLCSCLYHPDSISIDISPMDDLFQTRRRHVRTASSDNDMWTPTVDNPTASGSTPRTTASRIMHNVRRSFSSSTTARRRDRSPLDSGMYSTPEESTPPSPSRYNFSDLPDTRPTIEQIAMGLHVSRTPHLVPVRTPRSRSRHRGEAGEGEGYDPPPRTSMQRRRTSASATMLPPSPQRSSLKKPDTSTATDSASASALSPTPWTPSASDASLSTLTSNAPSTPRSSRSATAALFSAKLQLRMARLLPGRKNSGSSSRSASPVVTTDSSEDDAGSAGLVPRKMVRFLSHASEKVGAQDPPS
ncbi:hypothetical protein A0H81_06398 [Grifola frondosa]|uniref:Uncharacterized protein n=1 Tax=Grifola frondosa TaxID=5627 RepID=A0A1C7MCB2_GRIFR|nr:hypothetical protein A0H81_06398 [Grifola frondosa]